MNLGEVRQKFVDLSGREDLQNDDDSDNGANFFIASGQRFLDRLDTVPKSIGKVFVTLTAGDWYATFQECRAVKKVYAMTSETRYELEKKALGWILLSYPEPIANIDQGTPTYYGPAILREVPQNLTNITISKFVGETVQVDTTSHLTYNGIIWMPPCEESMILEIQGLFYSEVLSADADQSHWSSNYPDILIWAALRSLEISYRNTEGAKDWKAAILEEVSTLGMDLVEEEIADVD